MTFVGVAPTLPRGTRFDIVLFRGYQAVHDAFALVVAAHELALPKTLVVGAPLFADVLYDGESLTGDAAAKYTVETSTDWLQFNATSQTLVGAGAVTAHASITVGGQTVRVDAPVDVPGLASSSSSLSTSTSAPGNTLALLVVRPGADVDYDLCAGTTVTDCVQWLHADGSQVCGTAPTDAGICRAARCPIVN